MKLPSQPKQYDANLEQQRSGIIEKAVTTLEGKATFQVSPQERAAGVTVVSTDYCWGDVRRYGAVGDGVTGASSSIQDALTVGGKVTVPRGTYLIDSDLVVGDNLEIWFEEGAKFIASANNRTFFKSPTHAYYTTFHNVSLDGNGKTGVIGFDMAGFRHSAGIYRPYITNCNTGIYLKQLCWDTVLDNPHITLTTYPIKLADGTNACEIIHPALDTYTTGITITNGPTYDCADNNIVGGYIQNGTDGIVDGGIGTKITRVYFEANTGSDVEFSAARRSSASYTSHRAEVGVSAIKARNSSGITVFDPGMSSGARSSGLYDFDATNTNCVEYHTITSGSMNLPLGTMTGLASLPLQESGMFTPVIEGSSSAGTGTYSTQYGSYVRTGSFVTFSIEVTWSAHTGTGNIVVSGLPISLTPTNFTPRRIFSVVPVNISYTGPLVYGYLNGTNTKISVIECSTTGVEANIALDTSATLYLHGSFDVYGDS